MKRLILTCLLALGVTANASAAESLLIVLADEELKPAIAPLVKQRESEGLEVTVATPPVEEAIVTSGDSPDFLLLVGTARALPPKAGSQYRWRSTQSEQFAADPLFSDLDDDGFPNFPVGRIPSNDPETVTAVVAKILKFESRQLGPQDLNLPIWSGTPAYGKLLDETADWLLMSTIRKHSPDWAQPWIISANPNNTLNGWPQDQPELFNEQILKGASFTCMIGHGSTTVFQSMIHPERVNYTLRDAAALDDPDQVAPPLLILACDCGNFASRRSSLAATLLLGKGGPVATIAATTESHPLTNFYSSIAVMEQLSKPGPARAGKLWFDAQAEAAKMRKPFIERALKNVEGSLDAEINIPKLKVDQTQMYAFLGDPSLKLSLPNPLPLEISKSPEGASSWRIERPESAERLIVQYRPIDKPLRARPEGSDRKASLDLFHKRNAQFAYRTIGELDAAGETWQGQIAEAGELRFIATGKSGIWVATGKNPSTK